MLYLVFKRKCMATLNTDHLPVEADTPAPLIQVPGYGYMFAAQASALYFPEQYTLNIPKPSKPKT